jgi:hypothetical protein
VPAAQPQTGVTTHLQTVLARSSNNLAAVELERRDCVVVFDRVKGTTSAKVPYLDVIPIQKLHTL